MTKLYDALATWWPLMSAPGEYEEEAAIYSQLLRGASESRPTTLLEIGSGGGNNASFMKRDFDNVVLIDLSAGMLEVSRALNPECEHHQGDMRTVRLQRQFDCVFVHDAICYATSHDDLRRTLDTAYAHCRPGGVALFCPDYVRETYRPSTDCGGHDDGQRAMRWLEWSWDPNPDDTTYVVDYAYLLRERDGSVTVEHDQHLEGLFPRADWLQILARAGFTPQIVPFEHSDVEPGTCELFLAHKPTI